MCERCHLLERKSVVFEVKAGWVRALHPLQGELTSLLEV